MRWMATGWNAHLLFQVDPTLAKHFFDTPQACLLGGSPRTSPVLDGLHATPGLSYDSYTAFAADVKANVITFPYPAVFYNPEAQTATPGPEQQNPLSYLTLFGQLAHSRGYSVWSAPARDLATVSTAPKLNPKEAVDAWYLRANVSGVTAGHSDITIIQSEFNARNPAAFVSLVTAGAAAARAANPFTAVFAEVSTDWQTTASQMLAATQSVVAIVDGMYVSYPTTSDITTALAYFRGASLL